MTGLWAQKTASESTELLFLAHPPERSASRLLDTGTGRCRGKEAPRVWYFFAQDTHVQPDFSGFPYNIDCGIPSYVKQKSIFT